MKKVFFLIAIVFAFFCTNAQNYDKLSGNWENGEMNLFLDIDKQGNVQMSVWIDVDGNPTVDIPPIMASKIATDTTILLLLDVSQEEINNLKKQWEKVENGNQIRYWNNAGTMYIENNTLYSHLQYNYDADKDVIDLPYFWGWHSPSFYVFTREKTPLQRLMNNTWETLTNDNPTSDEEKKIGDFLKPKYKFNRSAEDSNKNVYEISTGEGFFSSIVEKGQWELSPDGKILSLKKWNEDKKKYDTPIKYTVNVLNGRRLVLSKQDDNALLIFDNKDLREEMIKSQELMKARQDSIAIANFNADLHKDLENANTELANYKYNIYHYSLKDNYKISVNDTKAYTEMSNKISDDKAMFVKMIDKEVNTAFNKYGHLYSDKKTFDEYYCQGIKVFLAETERRMTMEELNKNQIHILQVDFKKVSDDRTKMMSWIAKFEQKPYYEEVISYLIKNNQGLNTEYAKNGPKFSSAGEFYKAFTSDNYKAILKSKK